MKRPLPIVERKVESVTSTGWPSTPVSGALHFPQTAALPLLSGGTRFA